MPLAKLLYSNRLIPKKYTGVDVNKFNIPEMLVGKKIPVSIWAETDICALDPGDVGLKVGNAHDNEPPLIATKDRYLSIAGDMFELPNVLVCFEVLEHVTPEFCRRVLIKFQELTSPDCHYFISTPCYNGSAAGNHINEMTFGALGSLIEDLGYKVEGVYGTFASITDYAEELFAVTIYDKNDSSKSSKTDLRDVFAALRNYYDTNVLAVIFAPLFPAHARNCLWHLTCARPVGVYGIAENLKMFTKLELQPTPWSHHPDWIQLSGYDHVHTEACEGQNPEDGEYDMLCKKEGLWLKK